VLVGAEGGPRDDGHRRLLEQRSAKATESSRPGRKASATRGKA
jgi:hypothetical protein